MSLSPEERVQLNAEIVEYHRFDTRPRPMRHICLN